MLVLSLCSRYFFGGFRQSLIFDKIKNIMDEWDVLTGEMLLNLNLQYYILWGRNISLKWSHIHFIKILRNNYHGIYAEMMEIFHQ